MSDTPPEVNPLADRAYGVTASAKLDTQAEGAMARLNAQMREFIQTMDKMKTSAAGYTSAVGGLFKGMAGGAQNLSSSLTQVTSTMGNIGTAMFGSANEKGWVKDFMMFPTRFMRGAITDNRQLALSASAGLAPMAFGAGTGARATTTQAMMSNLTGLMASSRLPGGVLGGSPNDMLNLVNIMSRVGAGVDWQNPGGVGNAPRAGGFLRGVAQAQRIMPGVDLGQMAATIGGYAGNVGAQQQSAFLTGGAFSMIGPGNKQKSVSEWAEGILKWLTNLRSGSDKGKSFTYGQLMSQNFPGSNIDAWLSANGIPDDMKQLFWSYAMARSNQAPGGKADDLFQKNDAVNQSVAFQRLQAASTQTKAGYQLAGQMSGAYANKEQANRFMNEILGQMLNQILPSALSSGVLSYMQYLPDQIEEIIMQLAERTNLGTLGAGVVGWGAQFPGMLGPSGAGDVGDQVGDYGPMGATTTAGLHPSMKARVDAMMKVNPRLHVTSGYRDLAKQQSLRRKGVGRVSGRPSDHTRGMAADMGPRSQYPWLVANAGRFGLRNGARQGEPWHVGMGDITDVGQVDTSGFTMPGQISQVEDIFKMGLSESFTSMLSGLFKGMMSAGGAAGASPEKQIAGIGGGISDLLKGMLGIFTQGEADPSKLKFRNVYEQLIDAANKPSRGLTTGVDTGSGSWWSGLFNDYRSRLTTTPTTPGATTPTTPHTGANTLGAFFTDVLTGLGASTANLNLDKLAAVAKFEGGGGSYNPFNSTGGRQFPKFNSAGVKNYPDWNTGVTWTVNLLNQSNTSAMRSNLKSDGGYANWMDVASDFYQSWGGPRLPNISQSSADAFLDHSVPGAGDLDYAAPMVMPTGRSAVNFHNTFNIQSGGSGGNGNNGIDMRRTVQVLADQLESEMKRRMARTN